MYYVETIYKMTGEKTFISRCALLPAELVVKKYGVLPYADSHVCIVDGNTVRRVDAFATQSVATKFISSVPSTLNNN